jgi:hypothetical protein
MLTQHDVTIPNALDVFEEVRDSGLRCIGCKDIGLPHEKLQQFFAVAKRAGMTTFLEVVSNNEQEHFAGVETAIRVGADYLIGGMPEFTEKTAHHLRKEKVSVKFFPYIGEVVGHPCCLQGSVDEIVISGVESEKSGADGTTLLLYRYTGDVDFLLGKTVETLKTPLIVAGGVDDFDKIDQLKQRNIWAFTIGRAIFDNRFAPEEEGVRGQVTAVLAR